MPSRRRSFGTRVLPPWLWFWLVVYWVSLPGQFRHLWLPMLKEVFSAARQPGEGLIPFSFFFRFSIFAELLPLLLVALGVVTLFLPKWRIREIQRKYDLKKPPEIPVIGEIREFLLQTAPGIVIKANLLRTDQLAFVYPTGYRATAIALFGGFIKLWRRDRQAAEAVLLHETGHVRQGDALVVRAGSFFETLLNVWLPLAAGLVVLPLILIWSYDAIRLIAGNLNVGSVRESIGYKFVQLITVFLPALLFMILAMLFRMFAALILPLMGIWGAELSADRFAINAQGTSEGLLRGTALPANPTSWGRWLIAQMSHPPNEMRRWMAVHSSGPVGAFLPVGLFPAAYFGQLVMLLAGALTTNLITRPTEGISGSLLMNAEIYLKSRLPVFIAIAAFLLLWPWLAGYWERFFCPPAHKAQSNARNEH